MQGKRKSSYFVTRITPDLRAALQAAAERRGHSLSHEIEQRLRDSVRSESKEVWGGVRNRGLALLVNRLAQTIENYTGENWVANDYTYRALRAAIEELFRILDVGKAPPGRNTDLPKKVRLMIKSSEERANEQGTAFRLLTPEASGQFFANVAWTHVMTLNIADDLTRSTTDEFRVLARMRSMLGIKPVPVSSATYRELP